MISGSQCWYLKSPKQTRILIAPPHIYVPYATQATISSVKQSKTEVAFYLCMLIQISNDFQWLLCHVQCRQTFPARHVQCRHGVTHLLGRNKATLVSDRRPSAPWVLYSAEKLIRYLHGSYFLPNRPLAPTRLSKAFFLTYIPHL